MQVAYRELHEQITQLVQAIVPDTERYQLPEAETALVYSIEDHDYHDPIMHSTLELNKSVSDRRVQQLYSQYQSQEMIDQAERQAASAR